MKMVYWATAAAVLLTFLVVMFVPGADDHVEQVFQSYVGRAARS